MNIIPIRWRELCHRVEEGLTQLQSLIIKMPLAAEVGFGTYSTLYQNFSVP